MKPISFLLVVLLFAAVDVLVQSAACKVAAKIEQALAAEGRIMNSQEQAGDEDIFHEFYKNVEWQGMKITADMLRSLGAVGRVERTVDKDTQGMVHADTWVVFWVENWEFMDGTKLVTHEASKIKFDLKTCEMIELKQVVDNDEQKRMMDKAFELIAKKAEEEAAANESRKDL